MNSKMGRIRRGVLLLIVCALSLTAFDFALAEDAAVPVPVALQKSDVEKAVDRALEFLARQQRPDGSFAGGKKDIVGIDALAVMAFLACGHVPGEGPYHEVVEKGIAYVISQQTKEGVLDGGGGRMYGHGMATLMLGEVVGMTYNDKVKEALVKAIEVIVRAQAQPKPPQHDGGWRYTPTSKDSDTSVTGWQLIALRAAKDAGIDIKKEVIDKAVAYIKRCSAPQGGFGYTGPGVSRIPTAIGIVCLQMAGEYDAPEIWRAADLLMRTQHTWGSAGHFYYMTYYGTFGMYQCGGKYWETWFNWLKQAMLPNQQADGSWPPISSDGQHGGVIYSTAMAVLSLAIEYHYLPAYQR